jgi:hypothetical protein
LLARLVIAGLVLGALSAPALSDVRREANGFSLTPALIPEGEILQGGPPRDGIPALDSPHTTPVATAEWNDAERVVGVIVDGQARAYPIAILEWHELINDTLGGTPILVSYCPLCDSALVFDRRLDGRERRFGVSGLLHKSDLLMFDRETESLWSQIVARAVTGELMGKRLRVLRSRVEPWGRWKHQHPETTILSRRTGHRRRYGTSPYGDYRHSDRLLFPAPEDRRLHPKTPVVGLRTADGVARAYSAEEVADAGGSVIERFAGHGVEIRFDGSTASFQVTAPPEIEVVEAYWFAWAAFHPETSIFRAAASD